MLFVPVSDSVFESSNREFTDRAVNELEDTQQVQLGNYQDAAPISASGVSGTIMQKVHESTNMETFNFNDSLDREFQVASLTWSTDQAEDVVLQTLNFPDVLFAIPYIADKIKDFRLFKGGLRITVRVAASKFLYGKLMMSYRPDPDTLGAAGNLYRKSGSPHMLISAAASEVAVFDIPFISQWRALDIPTFAPGEMGDVMFTVLNPLRDINGETGKAQILITAQFMDAKVFLPHDSFVTESRSYTSTKAHMSSKMKGAESRAKSAARNVATDLEQSAPIQSGLETISFVSELASDLATGVSSVLTLGAMLGLSKPTSQDIGSVMKININNDLNYGKGIDTVSKLAMDPENAISTEPLVGGSNVDEMTLMHIMSTPQLVSINEINRDDTAFKVMTLAEDDDQNCFVDFVLKQFRYSSGSYKLKAYITASVMHAVRGVFYIADVPGSDWQNCYHQVVDIQGDTEAEFTCPYTSQGVMTDAVVDHFSVYFRLLSWSQPVDMANTPIYMNVYKAAASDMRVACYLDTCFVPESNPREDFGKAFNPIHPSIVGLLPSNIVCGEEYTTIREILHRYEPTQSTQGALLDVYQQTTGTTYGLAKWGEIFRFWRGSLRFKFIQKNNNSGCLIVRSLDEPVAGTMTSNNMMPQLEIEVPYYSNRLYKYTQQGNQPLTIQTDTRTPRYVFRSAGDDFSFHFLVGARVGELTQPVGANGLNGFLTFMATA